MTWIVLIFMIEIQNRCPNEKWKYVMCIPRLSSSGKYVILLVGLLIVMFVPGEHWYSRNCFIESLHCKTNLLSKATYSETIFCDFPFTLMISFTSIVRPLTFYCHFSTQFEMALHSKFYCIGIFWINLRKGELYYVSYNHSC